MITMHKEICLFGVKLSNIPSGINKKFSAPVTARKLCNIWTEMDVFKLFVFIYHAPNISPESISGRGKAPMWNIPNRSEDNISAFLTSYLIRSFS